LDRPVGPNVDAATMPWMSDSLLCLFVVLIGVGEVLVDTAAPATLTRLVRNSPL
jgi:hypothetical protein